MNNINLDNNDNIFIEEDLYKECILTERILVPPKHLNNNINDFIQKELIQKVEEKCIDEGYIKKDSIKIIKKSIGELLGSQFNGYITYNVLYKALVCHPKNGDLIKCKVKFINKLGILGNNGPLTIIIGRQFHQNQEMIDKILQGDIIEIEVIASKFSLNDKEIKIISKLKSNDDSSNIMIDTDLLDDENSDIDSLDDLETSHLNTEDDNEYVDKKDFDDQDDDNSDIDYMDDDDNDDDDVNDDINDDINDDDDDDDDNEIDNDEVNEKEDDLDDLDELNEED
jgi:DNA-directed RNA polymerase subunit E'/Rpb7